jgi:Na+-translocating ferredoxin:NAD+ oxidoreductase RnfE subunit
MNNKTSTFKTIRNSALVKNPLLFEAIGLCPVVAIAHSLKLAVFLAVVTAVELIVCEVLTSKFLKNVRRYWRVALYVVFGVAIIFPIMYMTNRLFPNVSANFGVYLPLMAVNSLIALHCERVAVKNDVKTSLIDAVSSALSYGVVAIIVGFLRELLASGTIWDYNLNIPFRLPAFLMPFSGMLLMGFLAAGLKAFIGVKYPEANPNKAFDTSEIRRSLRDNFINLMKDDFNPYGDTTEEDNVKIYNPEDKTVKIKKEKKLKLVRDKKTKDIVKTEDESPANETNIQDDNNRTYMDDFSDILSDLEEYKNKNKNKPDKKKKHRR